MDRHIVSKIIIVLGTVFVGIGQVLLDLDKKDDKGRNRRKRRRRE